MVGRVPPQEVQSNSNRHNYALRNGDGGGVRIGGGIVDEHLGLEENFKDKHFLRRNCWNVVGIIRCIGIFLMCASLAASIISFPSSKFRELAETNGAIKIWLFDLILVLNVILLLTTMVLTFCLPFGAYNASRKDKLVDFLITFITCVPLLSFGIYLIVDLDNYIEALCEEESKEISTTTTHNRSLSRAFAYELFNCSSPAQMSPWDTCVCDAIIITKYDDSLGTGMVAGFAGGLHLLLMSTILPLQRNRNANICCILITTFLGSAFIIGLTVAGALLGLS